MTRSNSDMYAALSAGISAGIRDPCNERGALPLEIPRLRCISGNEVRTKQQSTVLGRAMRHLPHSWASSSAARARLFARSQHPGRLPCRLSVGLHLIPSQWVPPNPDLACEVGFPPTLAAHQYLVTRGAPPPATLSSAPPHVLALMAVSRFAGFSARGRAYVRANDPYRLRTMMHCISTLLRGIVDELGEMHASGDFERRSDP